MERESLDSRSSGGEASSCEVDLSMSLLFSDSLFLLFSFSAALFAAFSAFFASLRLKSVLKDGAAGFNFGVGGLCDDWGRVPIGAGGET